MRFLPLYYALLGFNIKFEHSLSMILHWHRTSMYWTSNKGTTLSNIEISTIRNIFHSGLMEYLTTTQQTQSLQWRHNGHPGVWNHRRLDCLFSRLFRLTSKKTSKPMQPALCEGNPPVAGGFPHKEPITRKPYLTTTNVQLGPFHETFFHRNSNSMEYFFKVILL